MARNDRFGVCRGAEPLSRGLGCPQLLFMYSPMSGGSKGVEVIFVAMGLGWNAEGN
jgi:hypothetical protein